LNFAGVRLERLLSDGERDAAKVHAERAGVEAGIHEKARHGMRRDRMSIDRGDEHALMAASAETLLTAGAEKMSET
jgi:hypothetical protein